MLLEAPAGERERAARRLIAHLLDVADRRARPACTGADGVAVLEVVAAARRSNAAGGRGYFVPRPDAKLLQTLLKQTDSVRDVEVQAEPLWPLKRGTAYDGALTYIHKVKDGRDVYFFANSAEQPVDVQVTLRGAKTLAVWNPHTGETEPAEATSATVEGQQVTTVHLALGPVKSLFFVQSSDSH